MKNYDEKMVLNSHLVIKIEINRIRKNFVKSMSVKKFSYLGQFILGLRRSAQKNNLGCGVLKSIIKYFCSTEARPSQTQYELS